MAYFQLKSNNPNLSFIIYKNPNSGMQIKSLRKGHLFGWYSSENTYNCYFKDASNQVSYKANIDEQFEYINTSRYNSPVLALNVIDESFRSTLKARHEHDSKDFRHCYIINQIIIKSEKYIDFFNKHIEGFHIEAEEQAYKNYKLSFYTEKSLHELFNYIYLFLIFVTIRNGENFFIDEGNIEKNMTCLSVIDSPYYIRYIFKINFLRNMKVFEKFRPALEKSNTGKIILTRGTTLDSRIDKIISLLDFKQNIVDIGCGDGIYAGKLTKKLKDKHYYAIDKNPACLERTRARLERMEIDEYSTYESYEQFQELEIAEPCDYIMTEVIEHNDPAYSAALIRDIVQQENFYKLVITTPNKDFNRFYLFDDDELRHEDHLFEFTKDEFQHWLRAIPNIAIDFFNCGDEVDDVPVSIGAVVRRLA